MAAMSYFCSNFAVVTIASVVLYVFAYNTGAALQSLLERIYFGHGIMTDAFGEDLWK